MLVIKECQALLMEVFPSLVHLQVWSRPKVGQERAEQKGVKAAADKRSRERGFFPGPGRFVGINY